MTIDPKRVLAFALSLTCTVVAVTWLARHAAAQVPADTAQPLQRIGAVIDPASTAPLYASRMLERPPYAGIDFERDIAYGSEPAQRLDVVHPGGTTSATAPRPVLVFVHGGGFTTGRRTTGAASPFYDNVMLWAARHGMVGVNMDYRLAPAHPWPAGAQDVGAALDWVQAHIAARGGDPGRVFVLGHSAGAAHVAGYLADSDLHHGPGAGVAGAMLLSGLYRVTPELVTQSPGYAAYFGSDPARFRARSPLMSLVISPVPLWVGGAELDPPAFRQQTGLLRSALRDAETPFAGADFAGHNHLSTAYSLHSDDSLVGTALLAFMREHAGGATLGEVPTP
ncbi:MAG: alpha/beta hydrolase [Rhodoferax sp.]|nr:alpha/beta hydrolase [Rhodoferax sp.]